MFFDFGLLYLKNTHIFTEIFKSFRRELEIKTRGTIAECRSEIARLEGEKPNINVRIRKERIKRDMNKLVVLVDEDNAQWGKYAYLGLYSGIYGLLSLLIVGMQGCFYDEVLKNFLIIVAQLIFGLEVLTLIQIRNLDTADVPVTNIFRKVLWLILMFAGIFIMVIMDLFCHCLPDFETPFLCSTLVIVYFPFIVFLWRIAEEWIKTEIAERRCKDDMSKGI